MDEGGDGGSEASYESVPSEGGFEHSSERGRDRLPRIITSSHCVQVFEQLVWDDPAHCKPQPPPKEQQESSWQNAAKKAAANHDSGYNPRVLAGLPERLMRFDGAIEAWLEEMDLPDETGPLAEPYESLNDAASLPSRSGVDMSVLREGNAGARVWYFTSDFVQHAWPHLFHPEIPFFEEVWQNLAAAMHPPTSCPGMPAQPSIRSTHKEVGRIHLPLDKKGKQRQEWLQAVFAALQASCWNRRGEARTVLMRQHLMHASMSIGDAIQVGPQLYLASLGGFVEVKEVREQALSFLPDKDLPDGASEDLEDISVRPNEVVLGTDAKGKGKGKRSSDGAEDGKGSGKNNKGKGKGARQGKRGKGKGKDKHQRPEENAENYHKGSGRKNNKRASRLEPFDATGGKGGKGKGKGGGGGKAGGGGAGSGDGAGKGKGRTTKPEPQRARRDRRGFRQQLQAARDAMQGSS